MLLHCTIKYQGGRGEYKINTYALAFSKPAGRKAYKVNKEGLKKWKRLLISKTDEWTADSDNHHELHVGNPIEAIVAELYAWKSQFTREEARLVNRMDVQFDGNTATKIAWYKERINDIKNDDAEWMRKFQHKNPSLKTKEAILDKLNKELEETRSIGYWDTSIGEDPRHRRAELIDMLARIEVCLSVWEGR